MSSEKMIELLKRQEAEKQELADGAYKAWLPCKEREEKILSLYDGKYDNAPDAIQNEINKSRQEYFDEWGADGKLTALMMSRHTREREKLVEQNKKSEQLQKDLKPNRNHDHGR